jgi:cytidine deaminase
VGAREFRVAASRVQELVLFERTVRGVSGSLYLGMNLEILGHSLGFSVHGEQAVVGTIAGIDLQRFAAVRT